MWEGGWRKGQEGEGKKVERSEDRPEEGRREGRGGRKREKEKKGRRKGRERMGEERRKKRRGRKGESGGIWKGRMEKGMEEGREEVMGRREGGRREREGGRNTAALLLAVTLRASLLGREEGRSWRQGGRRGPSNQPPGPRPALPSHQLPPAPEARRVRRLTRFSLSRHFSSRAGTGQALGGAHLPAVLTPLFRKQGRESSLYADGWEWVRPAPRAGKGGSEGALTVAPREDRVPPLTPTYPQVSPPAHRAQ